MSGPNVNDTSSRPLMTGHQVGVASAINQSLSRPSLTGALSVAHVFLGNASRGVTHGYYRDLYIERVINQRVRPMLCVDRRNLITRS